MYANNNTKYLHSLKKRIKNIEMGNVTSYSSKCTTISSSSYPFIRRKMSLVTNTDRQTVQNY
jgi:hypothetical protein